MTPTNNDEVMHLPFGLTKQGIWEWVWRIVMLFGFLGLIYFKSLFASTGSVAALDARITPIETSLMLTSQKVAVLEIQQKDEAAMLAEIRVDLAAIKAGQGEAQRANERSFDQVLRRLNLPPSGK